MSRGSWMSILGIYNYKNDVFKNMVFPTGFTSDEKQTVINNILVECAELELLYPSYDTMKTVIGLWSAIELPVWTRIYRAAQMEYNPIENYNRTETETITHDNTETHSGNDVNRASGTDSTSRTMSGSEAHTGTDNTSYSETKNTTNSGHDITENSITAYDSGSLYLHDKSDLTNGKQVADITAGTNAFQHGETVTTSGNESESMQHGKTDTFTHGENIDNSGTDEKESHISGNIGVTTSQQMLQQEIDISPALNVMRIIVDSFRQRFCLLVY